jgi:stage III sporulation protein AG
VGKWLQWFERKIGGGPSGGKRVQTMRWLIIVGLIGVSIMILNSFVQVKQVDSMDQSRASPDMTKEVFVGAEKEKTPFEKYEEAYAAKLRAILENLAGVGDVDILVTVESTEETVPHRDLNETQRITDEKDNNGASRHLTEVTKDGRIVIVEVSGKEQPIIQKIVKPKISGVAIVAEGAENITVQKLIKEIVSKGLDVSTHRITVAPRKHQ